MIELMKVCEVLCSTGLMIGRSDATAMYVEQKDEPKERAIYFAAQGEALKLKKHDHAGSSTKGEVLDLMSDEGIQKKRAEAALWPYKFTEESLCVFGFGAPECTNSFPAMYAAAQQHNEGTAVKVWGHTISEKAMRGNSALLGTKVFVPKPTKLAELHMQLEELLPERFSRDSIANFVSPQTLAASAESPLLRMATRVKVEDSALVPSYAQQPVDLVMARDVTVQGGACVKATISF